MSETKRKVVTPYARLLEEIQDFGRKVRYPHTVTMWNYPKANLSSSWRLDDLWERTQAAEQLGYEVNLVANDEGLRVVYRKKAPPIPWI